MTHSATKQRLRTFENLETKKLMTADIGLDIGAPSESMFEVGSASAGDSFSFGVEREMKESGEKGGTADMNIGVGELQECTVSKSMDAASAKLAQFAINGNSPSTAEIDFVEVAGGRDSAHTSHDSMGWDNVKNLPWESAAVDKALQSWNTVGDADARPTEEVAF